MDFGEIIGVLIGWLITAVRAVFRFVVRRVAALIRRWKLENRYRRAVAARHKFLDPPGLADRPGGPIRLKDIYVEPRLEIYEPQTPGAQDEAEEAPGRLEVRKAETVSVSEAFGRHDRIIILGDPGLGKTTLLSYLALLTAQGEELERIPRLKGCLPIYLRLRDVTAPEGGTDEQGSALIEPLVQACSLRTTGSAGPFVRRGLEAGRCLILLDGLDEVADQAQRVRVSDWIGNLVSVYPKNLCIVASRSPGYRSSPLGAGFREAQIAGFSPEQVSEFARNWYRVVDAGPEQQADRQAEALLSRIRDDDRLSDLASNPLLLCLMVFVHIRTGDLPTRRAELYEQFSNLLLEDWERQKGAEVKLTASDCRKVLADLALDLHKRRVQAAPRSDVEGILSAKLEALGVELHAKPRYLAYLRERVPLLKDQGGSQSGFPHPSFQEYLAALALAKDADAVEFLVARRFDPWWREVTLLFAGLRDASELVERLAGARDDIFQQSLLLAGMCVADAPSVKPELREDISGRIESLFWEGEWDLVRSSALEVLAALKDTGVLERTIAATRSHRSKMRARAAYALGKIGGERAVECLIPLLKDEDSYVRGSAARTLGKIGGERAVEVLIPLLKDEDSRVWRSAAYALGEIGGERAVECLIPLLKDEDSDVRGSAADVLGEIGGERAEERLIPLLKDADSNMRGSAADALRKIGGERAEELLIPLLKDEISFVRASAAGALGEIGGERAVECFIPLLKDEDWSVRKRAADALGEIGGERAVESLIPLLKDEDSRVRRSAAEALGEIGGGKAVEPLIPLLKDEDAGVRGSAASALGKIGGERAVDLLIPFLKDEDAGVRWSAASALGKIGGERAVECLIPLLKDEDSRVWRSAAYALGEIGGERAVEVLIPLLKDEDSRVWRSAAYALGEIGGERALDHLIPLLKDEDSRVWRSAAYALGEIGGERAVECLIPLLKDEDSDVRGSAADVLGEIGGERAEERLIPLLKDEDSFVRWSAARALRRICARERLVIYEGGQIQHISDCGLRISD